MNRGDYRSCRDLDVTFNPPSLDILARFKIHRGFVSLKRTHRDDPRENTRYTLFLEVEQGSWATMIGALLLCEL